MINPSLPTIELSRHRISEDVMEVGGHEIIYDVLSSSACPSLPFFAGRYGGRYFVSREVPPYFQRAWIMHEVACLGSSEPDHCLRAVEEEMKHVPEGREKEYLESRIEFFDKALTLVKTMPNLFPSDFGTGAGSTLMRYQELLSQYASSILYRI